MAWKRSRQNLSTVSFGCDTIPHRGLLAPRHQSGLTAVHQPEPSPSVTRVGRKLPLDPSHAQKANLNERLVLGSGEDSLSVHMCVSPGFGTTNLIGNNGNRAPEDSARLPVDHALLG